ncbi:aldose 1-epimerase [Dyella tabacisoli]|uniref:Aldose epimerase n=1 Tax=Dyella tabacisoli TaxID=2282381 RepID=A0A369UJ83_9GAMM|nr:aldose epimerase [Dyella tabacisoli]RDD80802.1 aldose epimerase [Dyella tabacisoli]
MHFRAEHDQWESHDVVVLSDEVRQRRVRIACRGATVLNMQLLRHGQMHDLAAGYQDAAELEARPGSRFAIMAPFANRIADARYRFDGESQDMQPGMTGAARAARHGYLRGEDFAIEQLGADAASASVLLTNTSIRPGVHPGYPYAVDVSVRYTLAADGLTIETIMRNAGDHAAPCFFGWHPYFRVNDAQVDEWELTVPASKFVRTDPNYIPLPGDAAYVALDAEPALDFRQPRRIGALKLDHAYVELQYDADGRARTRLRDPVTGLGLAVWQESGVMLVFSADTISRDVRRSLALEPMESMADAFNRDDCAAAIRLEPGAVRSYRCGVELDSP